jgi:hypothetical protein
VFSGSPAAKKENSVQRFTRCNQENSVQRFTRYKKKENSVQRFTRYKKRKQCSAVYPLK